MSDAPAAQAPNVAVSEQPSPVVSLPDAPRVAISPDHDLSAIVAAAGGSFGEGGALYEDGTLIVAGVTQQALDAAVAAYDPVAVAATRLAALKLQLSAGIDAQAQAVRDLYVTPGGAQAATYMFKQSQAVQAQAAQASTDAGKAAPVLAAQYPDLANEIGITVDPQTGQPATDLYGVMRAVLETLRVWLPLNRGIEATRLKTKVAIGAAATAATAQAAHDGVVWPNA